MQLHLYLRCKHSTGKKAKSQIDRGNEKERKNLFTPLDVGLPGIAGLVHRKGLGGWLVLSGLLVNKAWADDERQPPVPVVTYVIIFFFAPLSGLALALAGGCFWGGDDMGGFVEALFWHAEPNFAHQNQTMQSIRFLRPRREPLQRSPSFVSPQRKGLRLCSRPGPGEPKQQ